MSKQRVAYFYDCEVGNFYYGAGHPMKPQRIRMTHNMVLQYGMYKKMEVYRPHKATDAEIQNFHSEDYINFLKHACPDIQDNAMKQLQRFNIGDECPPFDGVYEFSRISAGGSIGGAMKLNHGQCDIAINWGGGLHHAKKSEASGFCYVNDIVLGILELLKYHPRVLYVDIDIHHGDGVEEAFYTTDRVMTCSFHKYGNYFPGTGDLRDLGAGAGKYYTVNVPLNDGITDATFQSIFKPVIASVMERFRPTAVVLQCGADSVTGDRLGCFNMTLEGHADCLRYLKTFDVPIMMLGGGGYTVRNVARCWTYETSIAINQPISDTIPFHEFFEYYRPNYKLHLTAGNIANQNSREYLLKLTERITENLRCLASAPSVAMQEVPADAYTFSDDELPDTEVAKDTRRSRTQRDQTIQRENEYSDSEDEGMGADRRRNESAPGENVSILAADKGDDSSDAEMD